MDWWRNGEMDMDVCIMTRRTIMLGTKLRPNRKPPINSQLEASIKGHGHSIR